MASTTTTTITTMTETTSPSPSPSEVRPRKTSRSKHLNLWRDIDSAFFPDSESSYSTPSYLYSSSRIGDPQNMNTPWVWPIDILARHLPAPLRTRLATISPQTYDLFIATFFSALAIVVLSVLFVGPRVGIITSIMGSYALGFGIFVGAGELLRLVDDDTGIRNVTATGAVST